MDTFIAFIIAAVVLLVFMWRYLREMKKAEARGREAAERGKIHSQGPQAQHPHIDASYCIGCAACTAVCPEGDVLAMLGGKAVIVNGHKCIGHSLCAEVCPVGAITMVMAGPSVGADMPYLSPEYETTIPNLFIAGELGGLALIKNAITPGPRLRGYDRESHHVASGSQSRTRRLRRSYRWRRSRGNQRLIARD